MSSDRPYATAKRQWNLTSCGLIRSTVLLTGLALLAAAAAAQIWPVGWMLMVLTNFQVQLTAVSLMLLAASILWRRRVAAWVSAAIFVANAGIVLASIPGPATVATGPTGTNVRVMTYNLLFSNRNIDALREALVRERPDVVLLQEANWHWARTLPALADLYPYQVLPDRQLFLDFHHATALLSRHPITQDARPVLGGQTTRMTAARVVVNGQYFWVASAHLVKPLTKFGQALQHRQMRDLGQWITDIEGPVILGGDFNSTQFNPHLAGMFRAAGLAIDSRGNAWWRVASSTYPAAMPLFGLKIDHVGVRNGDMLESKSLYIRGSDHRAIVSDLRLSAISAPD